MIIQRMVVVCGRCGAMARADEVTYRVAPEIVKHKAPAGWETKLGTENRVHLCPVCAKLRRRRESRGRFWSALKSIFRPRKKGTHD